MQAWRMNMTDSIDIKLYGVKELTKQLNDLEKRVGKRVLRRVMRDIAKPVHSQMVSRAPRGDKRHLSYTKRRFLNPGYLSRSVRFVVSIDRRKGVIKTKWGVLKEAFYGIAFLDKGIDVSSRRTISKKYKGGNTRKRVGILRPYWATARKIKPYSIQGKKWFVPVFNRNARNLLNNLKTQLAKEISRIRRNGNNTR